MFWISILCKAGLKLVFATTFLMWFVFSNRDNVYVLYHNYARDSGKGNSECYFKVGSIHDTYRKTYGQNGNITIDSLEESSNATVLNDTLKNVELKARGKWRKNMGLFIYRALYLGCRWRDLVKWVIYFLFNLSPFFSGHLMCGSKKSPWNSPSCSWPWYDGKGRIRVLQRRTFYRVST